MEKEKRIEDLEDEKERLKEKLDRVKDQLLWAKNGVRYLRKKLNEHEDAPTAEVVEEVGKFVEDNKDLIPGMDDDG